MSNLYSESRQVMGMDEEISDNEGSNSFYLNGLDVLKETEVGFKEQTETDDQCEEISSDKPENDNFLLCPCLEKDCTGCYYPCPRCKTLECKYWDNILKTTNIKVIRRIHRGHSDKNCNDPNMPSANLTQMGIIKGQNNIDPHQYLNSFITKDNEGSVVLDMCPYVENTSAESFYPCPRCNSKTCLYWELRLNFIGAKYIHNSKKELRMSNLYSESRQVMGMDEEISDNEGSNSFYLNGLDVLKETEVGFKEQTETDDQCEEISSDKPENDNFLLCPCLEKDCTGCYYPCPRCKTLECKYWDNILKTTNIKVIRRIHRGHSDKNCNDPNMPNANPTQMGIIKGQNNIDPHQYLNSFITKDNEGSVVLDMCPYVENTSAESFYPCPRCNSKTCLYWELRLNFMGAKYIQNCKKVHEVNRNYFHQQQPWK